jgi:hypothetical protein
MNKCLAQSNKSRTDCEATKKRFRRQWCSHKAMTLQEAKSIARHLGLTLREVRPGAYRVNFRDGNETTAYYTDNLEDAVNTAVEMARTRDVVQAVDETVATERVPGRIADLPLNPKAKRPEGEE